MPFVCEQCAVEIKPTAVERAPMYRVLHMLFECHGESRKMTASESAVDYGACIPVFAEAA